MFSFLYSRVAEMYREKLATLAARALQQYGLQVQCYLIPSKSTVRLLSVVGSSLCVHVHAYVT